MRKDCNKYRKYESEKRKLLFLELSPREYAERIQKLAKKLGI